MSNKTLISSDTERLHDAIEDAEMAFWTVIAKKYPEIKSGDLSPETAISLEDSLKKVVTIWLNNNQE